MEQLKISGLNFTYPGRDGKDLSDISLTVQKGDFILLFGRSGCGKSTFLKQLKPAIAPYGRRSGRIEYDGTEITELSERDQSSKIGFVSQNPENQIVTDKVWHELAFGLESLGYDNRTIRLRVAEMASFFGIQDWFLKPVNELSGGQRQILNLASVMVMQPEVLLLDEPTSQLDPIAVSGFLAMLRRINEELGVTILLSEHHLEEVLPICSRVLFMEGGRLLLDVTPRELGSCMKRLKSEMTEALPACVKIYAAFSEGETPITVREAKQWLSTQISPAPKSPASPEDKPLFPRRNVQEPAVRLEEIWYRYEKKAEDIVKGVSMEIPQGCLYGIVGGNGVGKSTLLSVIGGVNQPYRGKVKLMGVALPKIPNGERYRGLIGYLPQDPCSLFVRNTVGRDLEDMAYAAFSDRQTAQKRMERVIDFFHLKPLLGRHPYDLSGGEQQCAALAKVLLTDPRIILLDEPTKGIDAVFKKRLSKLFYTLKEQGKTVILVSHDIDFCAHYMDFCALMFNGEIISENETRKFFMGNSFYTTAANRIARGIFPGGLTSEDVIEQCRKNRIGG
ncbi:MAG TPA: energy-coupling factor ABC transporter ATP-binding protein [Clostridiales bacterium]|nr:energy-coupling factor ABC transporter ATP-binding protein [Clostridiales bacterium]